MTSFGDDRGGTTGGNCTFLFSPPTSQETNMDVSTLVHKRNTVKNNSAQSKGLIRYAYYQGGPTLKNFVQVDWYKFFEQVSCFLVRVFHVSFLHWVEHSFTPCIQPACTWPKLCSLISWLCFWSMYSVTVYHFSRMNLHQTYDAQNLRKFLVQDSWTCIRVLEAKNAQEH